MKKTILESVVILLLSLGIAVVFSAASPTGMNLLKKAFRIQLSVQQDQSGAGTESAPSLRK